MLSNGHQRLIAPVYLGRTIRGYCSFIIKSCNPVDALILKQLATCALYLYNEKFYDF